MPKLNVIIGSTRPGRIGLPIGQWFYGYAQRHGKFEVRLVDLAEVNLPLLDEPKHPRLRQYEHEHTKTWSAIVAEADAYAFVTPEYNHSAPAALTNAIDFVYHEWSYKPACFVSYGGIAGGTRSVQMLRLTLLATKTVPILDAVYLPFAAQQIKDGVFAATDAQEKSSGAMLDELLRWATVLAPMRAPG
jgi:NAD(P)H-dependent FMN reductase